MSGDVIIIIFIFTIINMPAARLPPPATYHLTPLFAGRDGTVVRRVISLPAVCFSSSTPVLVWGRSPAVLSPHCHALLPPRVSV